MPTFSRPSAATLVAIVVTLVVGSQASFAASSGERDSAPPAVSEVEVAAADASSVTVVWPPSRDNWKVAGYGVFVDGTKVGTVKPDQVQRWRNRDSLSYRVQGLSCGRSYTVGVDVFDRGDDHSEVTSTTVSTSACPDTTAPSAPTGMRQVATTESSVVLAWTPSSDNVGVVEYGLYDSGLQVASVNEASATVSNLACGKTYLLGIDAADAAGNRSARADSYFRTSACPSTNKPPSTPTGLTIASATQTGLTLGWSPSTDDVAVAGYGVYLSGSKRTETPTTSAGLTGLTCGTTYALGVDAFDGAGLRSNVAQVSAATSPCTTTPPPSSTGSVTQTIANGSTITDLVDWRAVYDRNGDKVEDDPGKIEFRIDGNLVLTEALIPFGDSFADGSITTTNGTHTFQVRALDDTGTLLATSTVTATVNKTTAPPPSSSTGVVTQTIANGSTITDLVDWRAVYDRNGDKVEDDPGKIEFRIDGNLVLTEALIPFGDSFADGSITTTNGTHTFQVRALDDTGTLLATSTVTATVNKNQTTPPPGTADTIAPSQPANLRVMSATSGSVTLAWNAATDNVGVTGYDVFRATTKVGSSNTTTYTINGLTCGTAYSVGVRAFDSAGNTSAQATTSVSTSACADTQPPTAPTNVSASTRTTTSIALTWAPSTDNVGVAAYGLYNGGELVNTTAGTTGIVGNLTCGTNYTLAVDAFDAAGNSSARTTVMVSTLACPDTTPPTVAMSSPTNGSTVTGTISASASATDSGGVTRVDFLRDGVSLGSDTSSPYSIPLNTTTVANGSHTLGARAYDSAGNVGNATVTVTVSNTASPSSTGSVTQTIANGSTITDLVDWRAVYDRNGDKVEDDPGSIQFLIDGKQVLSEINPPFGDSFADGSITTTNGTHAFEVRALDDTGTLLATNTVTATVNKTTTPPPPPPPPPTGGYPDASNTGVPSGTNLTAYTGPTNITTANTVIDGKTIGSCITVSASNVTIRNTKISCSNAYRAVQVSGGSVTIEDSEIDCKGTNNDGLGNSGYTLRRVDLSGCENGMNVAGNVTVEDSYIHDLTTANGAHTDGAQFNQGASNITFRHNTINTVGSGSGTGTSCIIMWDEGNPQNSNVLITGNLLIGTKVAFTIYTPRQGPLSNVRVTNNQLRVGVFGYNGGTGSLLTDGSGNVDNATGQPLNL